MYYILLLLWQVLYDYANWKLHVHKIYFLLKNKQTNKQTSKHHIESSEFFHHETGWRGYFSNTMQTFCLFVDHYLLRSSSMSHHLRSMVWLLWFLFCFCLFVCFFCVLLFLFVVVVFLFCFCLFFSNLMRFWYQKAAHIFLIITGGFYSWKMYHFEDTMYQWFIINGNHIKLITQFSKV